MGSPRGCASVATAHSSRTCLSPSIRKTFSRPGASLPLSDSRDFGFPISSQSPSPEPRNPSPRRLLAKWSPAVAFLNSYITSSDRVARAAIMNLVLRAVLMIIGLPPTHDLLDKEGGITEPLPKEPFIACISCRRSRCPSSSRLREARPSPSPSSPLDMPWR